MTQKKLALRKCIGCNEQKPKKELIRVVKNKEGEISLDFSGKKPGRGAYLCNDISCFQKAHKGRRLEKSLSTQIPNEVYDKLEEGLTLGKE